jgi:hypothetical protein
MKLRSIWLTIAGVVSVLLCAWLGLGVEASSADHESRYSLFVKSHPTATIFFRSYMGCDECDAVSHAQLLPEQQVEFIKFCRARYGFDDPRICDAIYAEQRKIRLEGMGVR